MRYVISRQEAEQLIGEIDGMDMIPIDNERQREETLKKALRTCDTRQWVRVIRRSMSAGKRDWPRGKKVTAGDERCLHAAQENLFGELAVSLGIEKNEVESYIRKKREKHK